MVETKISEERPALSKAEKRAVENLKNPLWRLSNLYWIQDKAGRTVLFKPNTSQLKLYKNLHTRNLILKARQLGFSTAIDIFLLDTALFDAGFHAGIVADTEDTAKDLFRTKIQFPYEHLPPSVQGAINIVTANKNQYEFTNGSVIETGVTLRSGTCQAVHVSEFGKISVEHPDRADEIVSGSLETVPLDGIAFIESTAKGRGGRFYEYYKQAEANETLAELSDLDYKLHFYPWFQSPEYKLDAIGELPQRLKEYFATLSVDLSPEQMMWYAKKEQSLGEDMKREYPSTPEEAFEQSLEGCYFSRNLVDARKAGHIGVVPYDPNYLVDTHWDLGMDDFMAILFTQTIGNLRHCIDYLEDSGEGIPYYADELRKRKYAYGQHFAPHDIQVTELSGKTRLQIAADSGIRFITVPRIQAKMDAIEMARRIFAFCRFDESKCAVFLKHMEEYRKEWDDVHGCWRNHPAKSEHNHAADTFMTMAQGSNIKVESGTPTGSGGNWTPEGKKNKWKMG